MPATIVVLGDRNLEYQTHREIDAALSLMPDDVEGRWVRSPDAALAASADAVWVAPGTPYEDDAAVLDAITAARAGGQPILGTCGGFQYMALEFARNTAGLAAAHAETDPGAADPVIAPLACSLVGEERIVTAVAGTRVAELCGTAPFPGFHFCNYGMSESHEGALVEAGLVIPARAPDAGGEAFELPDHPFYLATLFQPQVGSSATGVLHPLLRALVEAVSPSHGPAQAQL